MKQYLPTILLMAAFGAYSLWMITKRRRGQANLGPALRAFFERTGYRYGHLVDQPIEAQVQHAEATFRASGVHLDMDLLRDYHGARVHHQSLMGKRRDAGAHVMTCTWKLVTDQPPGVRFQAADKGLSSLGKALKEAFSDSTRPWDRVYPRKVESGDPELDKRLVFYGEDPEAVRRALQLPGLKEAMLGVPELDLVVDDAGVTFSDPMQKNVRAAMGGTIGVMAVGGDYAKLMSLTIPMHDQIAELLALASRASRA